MQRAHQSLKLTAEADVDSGLVPQNAIDVELCLRITNANPALAHWIGRGEAQFGQI